MPASNAPTPEPTFIAVKMKPKIVATDAFKVESKNDTTIESKDAKVGVTAKTTVDLTAGTTATFDAKDELTLKSKKITVNTAPTDCDAIAVKGKGEMITHFLLGRAG